MKLEAVIFNFHSLIADSQSFVEVALKGTCSEFGLQYDESFSKQIPSLGEKECIKSFFENQKKELRLEEALKDFESRYCSFIQGQLKAMEGFNFLFKRLKQEEVLCSIACSSPRNIVETSLEAMDYPKSEWDLILCEEDCEFTKIVPELYLLSLKKLKHYPENCAVIENTPLGIKAARQAELHCVGVQGLHSAEELSGADIIKLNLLNIHLAHLSP